MINRSIARRYARALLDLVEADPTGTAERLTSFAGLIEDNPTLEQVLASPAFSMQERSKVLGRLLSTLSWGKPLDRFLELLVERNRIVYIKAIAETFAEMVDEQQGRVRITLSSAVELDSAAVEKIKAALSTGLNQEVIVKQEVEPDLIAGVAVHVGGLVIDGSVKSQLARMREQLVRSRT